MGAYFDSDFKQLTTNDINIDFVVHEDLDADEDLIVTLEVATDKSETKTPLSIDIKVLGRFLASEELREKVKLGQIKHEQVVINGLAILYSSIRDQILSLTAKMPIGPVFLPTCTFNVQKNIPEEKQKETKPIKAVKKAKPRL